MDTGAKVNLNVTPRAEATEAGVNIRPIVFQYLSGQTGTGKEIKRTGQTGDRELGLSDTTLAPGSFPSIFKTLFVLSLCFPFLTAVESGKRPAGWLILATPQTHGVESRAPKSKSKSEQNYSVEPEPGTL